MKVVIGNKAYEMNRKQADGVLKVASEQIPFGIYAIERKGILELKKDEYQRKTRLKRNIEILKKAGFKVYANMEKAK